MASSIKTVQGRFLVDSIHGDVHLTEKEWRIIDTPSFQRLRNIKQLQMSHLTYPNATHTRFSHSVGTLAIMARVIRLALDNAIKLSKADQEKLRLAALLHDIGHYPYSHLMEGIEKVILLEDKIQKNNDHETLSLKPYPDHVSLGVKIVTSQKDIVSALGGKNKAQEIADIFSRSTLNNRLSTLISSSLDIDRFDYLMRDSYAVGLPYGQLDINYLLNSLKINSEGVIGVHERAIPAVEHFLLARYFMHRTVYCHRTTVALEEATRQLLRRIRDKGKKGFPKDETGIFKIVQSNQLLTFTDAYVDSFIREAVHDDDDVVRNLALSIQSRIPPKMLKEVLVFEKKNSGHHAGLTFRDHCYHQIKALAKSNGFEVGRFMFCEKEISFEKVPSHHTVKEYKALTSEQERKQEREEEEIVQIFIGDSNVPKSLLEVGHSIVDHLADKVFRIYRLYFVSDKTVSDSTLLKLKQEVKNWDRHS